jgi:hypothetical protein
MFWSAATVFCLIRPIYEGAGRDWYDFSTYDMLEDGLLAFWGHSIKEIQDSHGMRPSPALGWRTMRCLSR